MSLSLSNSEFIRDLQFGVVRSEWLENNASSRSLLNNPWPRPFEPRKTLPMPVIKRLGVVLMVVALAPGLSLLRPGLGLPNSKDLEYRKPGDIGWEPWKVKPEAAVGRKTAV